MEWLQQLNQAIEYIEENLAGKISYDKAAKIACCSTHHFQRMFSYVAGVPLSEYIRRRRMTAAAFDLQNENAKVSEIAAKYGYQSPTAFNRAFQGIHGLPPSAVRMQKPFLITYPRLRFQISVTGEEEMKYRIEPKGPIRVVGVRTPLETDIEKNFQTVPDFWQKTKSSETFPKILELMDQDPKGILGVTTYHGPDDFYHYIGVASDMPVPDNMELCEIPEQTWAIFQCAGPARLACQNAYRRFYTEWLPVSDYVYSGGMDIEVYPAGDPCSPTYQFELWLSVTKKGVKL